MEKEILLESEHIDICFLFEENLWSGDLNSIHTDLSHLCSSIKKFKTEELKVSAKLILNLNLCDDHSMRELNHTHRNNDKVTDVLSFPLQESLRSGDFESFHEEIELGDIFICAGVCGKQAEEFDLSFDQEFYHLLVHGFLHLCGYDHEISEEEQVLMEAFETRILLDFSKLRKRPGSHQA